MSPTLKQQLTSLTDSDPVGVVIVSFKTTSAGLSESHLDVLRGVGLTKGVTFKNLGMVGVEMTAGQVRALSSHASILSLWSNDQLQYHNDHSRTLTGVEKLWTDQGLTVKNMGNPVFGSGDFSVMVIDSGIDTTHSDLPAGTKVIQNTMRIVASGNTGITIGGQPVTAFNPAVSIENLPNTDNVGHGTHVAGSVGGLGVMSAGRYAGAAPGAKIVGSGGGVVIVVLSALAGWEYAMEKQAIYKIRVITNSYGPISPVDYSPSNPFTIASKKAYDRNITVLWSASNDGAEDTVNAYGQAPWTITVAAGSKDGMLAGFSSRGVPKAKRLSDNNPNNDNEYPTITAPGTGKFFESSKARFGFTIDIVGPRSSIGLTNLLGAGDDQAEINPGLIPFYTQMSGTSMATPFVAGVVALMLDADPTLTPDEIKQILIDTATRMPGYADHEVGAGYVNAHAAVDKVLNRNKGYKNAQEINYNAALTPDNPPVIPFSINYDPTSNGGPQSPNARPFTVESDVTTLKVRATVGLTGVGVTNLVGLRLHAPDGTVYSPTFALNSTSNVREGVVNYPIPGTWYVEARGTRGTSAAPVTSPQQVAPPGPMTGTVTQVRYQVPNIADIADHPQRSTIEMAIRRRLMDTYSNGLFGPGETVTRAELAYTLLNVGEIRQSLGPAPKFTDVSGDLARIAEAVTSGGASLKDYDFAPAGMMSFSGSLFDPNGSVSRLDAAVALIKALGYDKEARALAGTNVTFNGAALTDNGQIPAALRGYIQIAINKGMFEAFPAEIKQIGPGQYQAVPGPRFEPNTVVTRASLAQRLVAYHNLFTTGG